MGKLTLKDMNFRSFYMIYQKVEKMNKGELDIEYDDIVRLSEWFKYGNYSCINLILDMLTIKPNEALLQLIESQAKYFSMNPHAQEFLIEEKNNPGILTEFANALGIDQAGKTPDYLVDSCNESIRLCCLSILENIKNIRTKQYSEDKKTAKKIIATDYDERFLKIYFYRYQFNIIMDMIKQCGEEPNQELLQNILNLITKEAKHQTNIITTREELIKCILKFGRNSENELQTKTNQELLEIWKNYFVNVCMTFIIEIVRCVSENREKFPEVEKQLASAKEEFVRLQCCTNIDCQSFFNDRSPRIRKMARIINKFNIWWNDPNIDKSEKDIVKYFADSIKYGSIYMHFQVFNHKVKDKLSVDFCSPLLKSDEYGAVYAPIFDSDVLLIRDRRILGYHLYELYKNGLLEFEEDVILPDCFKQESPTHLSKTRKRNNSINKQNEVTNILHGLW